MVADHVAPRAQQLLSGQPMFAVEGGTQALQRIMVYAFDTGVVGADEISVPDEFGAFVLKGAAHLADRRDRERHLQDAAVLAACITDHAAALSRLGGSDRKRIRHLAEALSDPRPRVRTDESDRYPLIEPASPAPRAAKGEC
jgi:hypothetical protein